MRKLYAGLLILLLTACGSTIQKTPDEVKIEFSIVQDIDVYEQSIYGEPPQYGIWLEDSSKNEIKTVFVTRRTGTGDFQGKAEVPVALPAWIEAFRRETGRTDMPTPHNPVDMISGATQTGSRILKEIKVPAGTKWSYYIEVNVAGDYSPTFPSYQNGIPDPHGNGQPSLIYKGEITANPGALSFPELFGRTEQFYFSREINRDLSGIGSAKDLFKNIVVTCKSYN